MVRENSIMTSTSSEKVRKKAWDTLEDGINKLAQSGQLIQENFDNLKTEIR